MSTEYVFSDGEILLSADLGAGKMCYFVDVMIKTTYEAYLPSEGATTVIFNSLTQKILTLLQMFVSKFILMKTKNSS